MTADAFVSNNNSLIRLSVNCVKWRGLVLMIVYSRGIGSGQEA